MSGRLNLSGLAKNRKNLGEVSGFSVDPSGSSACLREVQSSTRPGRPCCTPGLFLSRVSRHFDALNVSPVRLPTCPVGLRISGPAALRRTEGTAIGGDDSVGAVLRADQHREDALGRNAISASPD